MNAAKNLVVPNPVAHVMVVPNDGSIEWSVEYRAPLEGGFDNVFGGLFARAVVHRGRLDFDPTRACVERVSRDRDGGDPRHSRRLAVLAGYERLFTVYRGAYLVPENPLDLGADPACTRELRVRIDERSGQPVAIEFRSLSGELTAALSIPRETPLRDPRRWGWLLLAPELDVLTIAMAVPITMGALVMELLDR